MDTTEPPVVVIASPAEPEASRAQVAPAQPDVVPVHHATPKAIDLGVGTFLMAGIASSGVVGVSPFVSGDLSPGVLFRLSASLGEAPASGIATTWTAGRIDLCSSIAGNYPTGSGLRLDLCGGADVGYTHIASSSAPNAPHFDQGLAYVDIGPSADLRAELGSLAAMLLRGAVGLNAARDTYWDSTGTRTDPSVLSARVELAFSWKLQ